MKSILNKTYIIGPIALFVIFGLILNFSIASASPSKAAVGELTSNIALQRQVVDKWSSLHPNLVDVSWNFWDRIRLRVLGLNEKDKKLYADTYQIATAFYNLSRVSLDAAETSLRNGNYPETKLSYQKSIRQLLYADNFYGAAHSIWYGDLLAAQNTLYGICGVSAKAAGASFGGIATVISGGAIQIGAIALSGNLAVGAPMEAGIKIICNDAFGKSDRNLKDTASTLVGAVIGETIGIFSKPLAATVKIIKEIPLVKKVIAPTTFTPLSSESLPIILTVAGIDPLETVLPSDLFHPFKDPRYIQSSLISFLQGNTLSDQVDQPVGAFLGWQDRDIAGTKPAVEKLKEDIRKKNNDAMKRGSAFNIITHSWGSVLTYSALTELANAGEDIHVDNLFTLGSPIGLFSAVDLYPADPSHCNKRSGLFDIQGIICPYIPNSIRGKTIVEKPRGVDQWINFWSRGDLLSYKIDSSKVVNYHYGPDTLPQNPPSFCNFLVLLKVQPGCSDFFQKVKNAHVQYYDLDNKDEKTAHIATRILNDIVGKILNKEVALILPPSPQPPLISPTPAPEPIPSPRPIPVPHPPVTPTPQPPKEETALAIITTVLVPAIAIVNTLYSSEPIVVTGGKLPYTWQLYQPAPPGLSINENGVIEGTPTKSGTYNFTVEVKDNSGGWFTASQKTTQSFTLVVNEVAKSIPPPTDWNALLNKYSPDWDTKGYAWGSIDSHGVTQWYRKEGNKWVQKSSQAEAQEPYSATTPTPPGVVPSPLPTPTPTPAPAKFVEITTTSLSPSVAVVNTPYSSAQLQATGGTSPYKWSLYSESSPLPPGLKVNNENGVIEGTPTQSGPYTFFIEAKDSSGERTAKMFTLVVNEAKAAPLIPKKDSDIEAALKQFIESNGGTYNPAIIQQQLQNPWFEKAGYSGMAGMLKYWKVNIPSILGTFPKIGTPVPPTLITPDNFSYLYSYGAKQAFEWNNNGQVYSGVMGTIFNGTQCAGVPAGYIESPSVGSPWNSMWNSGYISKDSLPAGKTYSWYLIAYASDVRSIPSACRSFSVQAPALPLAPSHLSVVAKPTGDEPSPLVVLTWQDNSQNEFAFILALKEDGGSWSDVFTFGKDITSAIGNYSMSAGKSYCYKVKARGTSASSNYSNFSDYSNEACVTIP